MGKNLNEIAHNNGKIIHAFYLDLDLDFFLFSSPKAIFEEISIGCWICRHVTLGNVTDSEREEQDGGPR